MKSIDLYYNKGNSDKEYHVQMEASGSGYLVNFQYGRVGNALQTGTKTPNPVSQEDAEKIYNKLVKEKMSKGYAEREGSEDKKTPSYSGPAITVKETFGIFPQLLNDVSDPKIYINDDRYLAQEKKDGQRLMAVAEADLIKGLNKKGQQVQLPLSISTAIYNECILDGEIIGEKLFVFDLISMQGTDLKSLSCQERLETLNGLVFGKGIEVVKTAYTREEKQAMYDQLVAENKEGIVFKLKDATYTAGRPNSGGNALKHKFYKEASFIVKDFTKGKRSIGLELIDENNERVFMGKCTVPPNKDLPEIGSVVEVRYLYAYKGGAVFQPTYKDKRTDVDVEECVMNQIIYKEGQE